MTGEKNRRERREKREQEKLTGKYTDKYDNWILGTRLTLIDVGRVREPD